MNTVLETVIEGIEYTFEKDILVKPLEPVMITKEYEEQIPTGEQDEEGFNKYEVKTIVFDGELSEVAELII